MFYAVERAVNAITEHNISYRSENESPMHLIDVRNLIYTLETCSSKFIDDEISHPILDSLRNVSNLLSLLNFI